MSDRVARLAELRRQRDGEVKIEVEHDQSNQEKAESAEPSPSEEHEVQRSPEVKENQGASEDVIMDEPSQYNSDLKQDIASYLAKAERNTETAINRLALRKYQEAQRTKS
ncbi:hypothetical protein CXQ85_003191 [Candidozyma haemuli]|uniref:Uncharacterized protein n=1 Tax=Candidozyma haemuli TaxID=45357 RepID=A0A2V1ANN8_9ASCO|nr:hypothetical protein CXQ85_003191 [[Candida] haemuloni]PVH19352.1 hypothetical protein CXQ85_003191 [[Candida] haemuloni]